MPSTPATAPALDASVPPLPSPGWTELLPHRPQLLAYARRRLPDPTMAEDLVHDVFEAVVTGRAQFGGRSALRTWLVGILRHKILDLLSEPVGCDAWPCRADEADDEDLLSRLPCPWPGPLEHVEQRQRLGRVLQRIQQLPEPLRKAIELRVLHDLDSSATCRQLDISAANLFVRLHRARRLLMA